MKFLLMCAILLGCDKKYTPLESLQICHTVCGPRALDDFSADDSYGYRISCRCGDMKFECSDAGCKGGTK